MNLLIYTNLEKDIIAIIIVVYLLFIYMFFFLNLGLTLVSNRSFLVKNYSILSSIAGSKGSNSTDSCDKEMQNFYAWFSGFTDAFSPLRGYLLRLGARKFSIRRINNHLSLVVWGSNLTSLVGTGKFTKQVSLMIKIPPYQRSVIIGLLLSDGWLTIASKTTINARLGFKQSISQSSYVWFVFNELSHYCSSYPHLTKGIRAGNPYYGIQFFTRTLPCFTELYSIFYTNKVKRIPDNIYDLLTPVALAHWICGDGYARQHGLIFCTDSYSIEEVVKLVNVLMIKFRVECTIRVHRENQYRIYIRERSMPLVRQIVKSHFYPSMLYKL